ncbi:MAG: DUF393 domain-containing protein [Verrucomicrobiales bacterium]|jgi:predicted DCC family thiol-disulfide oxidoreductase YuxK
MKREKHILLFDSDCPMCTFQSRTLAWLDWLNCVEMVALKSERTKEIAPDITREDLLEAIHCITPDDEIHRGARAFRFLGMRIPLLIPVGLFLWLPGVIWVAEKVYAFVSRNRHLFSKIFGCKGACAIMPEKKNEG